MVDLDVVFASFESVSVGSDFDIVYIKQGSNQIALPSAMIEQLIASLKLAEHGEI